MSGTTSLLQQYVDEREGLVQTVEVLTTTTLDRKDKNLSEADQETIRRAKERITGLDAQIELLADSLEMSDSTVNKLRMAQGDKPIADPSKYRSAGHMLWDALHATAGNRNDPADKEAVQRWDRVMKRAAQHMGTEASVTTAVAGGFGGLWVNPVVGPVIDMAPKGQPLLTAIGKQQAPNSLTFVRPRIVDPNFKTGAAKQALQKAELTSVKFDVKTEPLSLDTVGGYLNVSQQLLSLHPEALNIIITQMQRRTAWQGEALAILELAESTSHVELADNATAPQVIAALFEAARIVYEQTMELPEWIAYGPVGWARLGSLVDSAGRPLFPYLGAQNALGTAQLDDFGAVGPLGLRQVVTPGITNGDIWIGNSSSVEVYSYPFPVLEAIEPSVLGRQVAVAEAIGFYRPPTTETPSPAGNGAVLISDTTP